MTAAGIVIGTLSLAAVGTGIALLLRPDQVIEDRPAYVDSTQPAGLVTVTIGTAVTVAAVLMLIAAHQGQPSTKSSARVQLSAQGLQF